MNYYHKEKMVILIIFKDRVNVKKDKLGMNDQKKVC